jgi:hypothetical protein
VKIVISAPEICLVIGISAKTNLLWKGSKMPPSNEPSPMEVVELYVANSIPEADLISQVLIEAGFRVEHVPTAATGMFGITGSNIIYIQAEDYDEAALFLKQYLNDSELNP